MRVLVTGATGFLGRETCHALHAAGHEISGLTRRPVSRLAPDSPVCIQWVQGDVRDPASLYSIADLAEADAIVHLVGIITETPARGQTFEAVHVAGTRNLVEAIRNAERHHRPRLVYVSACGASPDAPSHYARSKAGAEEAVRRSEQAWTILRPSIILGPGSGFLQQIERLVRRPPLAPIPLPFVPIPGSANTARFQPTHVADVAACIVRTLETEAAIEETIEVGGADALTLTELITGVRDRLGVQKPLVAVPLPLLFAGAACLEALLPQAPLTTDQLIGLHQDNVCDTEKMERLLGVTPRTVAEALEETYRARQRTDDPASDA